MSNWNEETEYLAPPDSASGPASRIEPTTVKHDALADVRPKTTIAQAVASRRACADNSSQVAPAEGSSYSFSYGGRAGGRAGGRTVSFSDEPSYSEDDRGGYIEDDGGDEEYYSDDDEKNKFVNQEGDVSISTSRQGRFSRDRQASSVDWHPVSMEGLGGAGTRGSGRGTEGEAQGASSVAASTEASGSGKKPPGKRLWRRCECTEVYCFLNGVTIYLSSRI